MAADELQLAIERAEGKRAELLAAAPGAGARGKVLSILPKAAAAYRAMIAGGLSKNPEAATRARLAVRQLVGGEIKLTPRTGDDGLAYLEASFDLQTIALVSQLPGGSRFSGSGGGI
jgi:hypothetical protein